MEKIKALAKYLGVDEQDVVETSYDSNSFETEEGEYLVLTEDEAWEYTRDYIDGCIDDLGLKDSFTQNFFEWILDNAIDDYFIENIIRDSNESLINDLKDDEGGEFENRLIEELYDTGYLSDDDFEVDEEGEIDYSNLKSSIDLDSIESDYLDYLVDNDDITNIMSEDELADAIVQNSAYNLDKITDEAISWDGKAHFLATYDGDEIELDDDLLAYRIN